MWINGDSYDGKHWYEDPASTTATLDLSINTKTLRSQEGENKENLSFFKIFDSNLKHIFANNTQRYLIG